MPPAVAEPLCICITGSVKLMIANAMLMRRLDELYTAHPFLGYRKLTALLRAEGHVINAKRVLRLLRLMGLQAIYQKPKTSKPHPKHPVYP